MQKDRLAGHGYARDPMCGMQVETANAVASVVLDGQRVYFCSDHCKQRFLADPTRAAPTKPATDTCNDHHAEHADVQEGHSG